MTINLPPNAYQALRNHAAPSPADHRLQALEQRLEQLQLEHRRLRRNLDATIHYTVQHFSAIGAALPHQFAVFSEINRRLNITGSDALAIEQYAPGSLTLTLPHETRRADRKPRP